MWNYIVKVNCKLFIIAHINYTYIVRINGKSESPEKRIFYTYKYKFNKFYTYIYINELFISVKNTYGPAPTRDEQRAIRKKIARVGEAQNGMAEALSRGNINQVGRTGWSELIDLVQETVMDEVNDARNYYKNDYPETQMEEVEKLRVAIETYKDTKGVGKDDTDRALMEDEAYTDLLRQYRMAKEAYDLEVHRGTFPELCNETVPKFMYSYTYNNRWDLCYGYATTDITADEMETFYEVASESPNTVDVDIDHKERLHRKEAMRTISESLEYPAYYTCSGKPGHTCPLPNAKKTPDVVVAILPEDSKDHLKIPVFSFEVHGIKKVTEAGRKQWPGFLATLQQLNSAPYAYYGEVDGEKVYLYKFQKIPEDGRIQIIRETIKFATDAEGGMENAFGYLIERLTDIFVDIFVNLSWLTHECSRLMKRAHYEDFVAKTDGRHPRGVEMHCWHYFDKKYFCEDKVGNPTEYIQDVDRIDPAIPYDKRERRQAVTYRIMGDELLPVLQSSTSVTEIPEIHQKLRGMGFGVLSRATSRAIRNTATGQPACPTSEEMWQQGFTQFRANISKFVEQKIPSFHGTLQHGQFDKVFNSHIRQPRASTRKSIVAANADASVVEHFWDYSEDEDADEDDVEIMEYAEEFGMEELGTPVRRQILRSPQSGPSYRAPRHAAQGK